MEMNYYDVKRFGMILAIQAQIDGMKADNENRKQNKEGMAYTYEDFLEKSNELEYVIHCPEDKL